MIKSTQIECQLYEKSYKKSYSINNKFLNIGDKCSNYIICGNRIEEEEKYVCYLCANFLGDISTYCNYSNLVIINSYVSDCKNCIHKFHISQNQLDLNLGKINIDSDSIKLIGGYLFGNIRVQLPQCNHFYCKNCFIKCFLQEEEIDYPEGEEEIDYSEEEGDVSDFEWPEPKTNCIYCHRHFDF